jgi:hypothetical protein
VVTAVNIKIDGKITKIGSSSFTVLVNNGTSYIFHVTSNTTYTGYGVTSLSQLTKGIEYDY